jgi:hypothetical protein
MSHHAVQVKVNSILILCQKYSEGEFKKLLQLICPIYRVCLSIK